MGPRIGQIDARQQPAKRRPALPGLLDTLIQPPLDHTAPLSDVREPG
jgi:hypothetical protein